MDLYFKKKLFNQSSGYSRSKFSPVTKDSFVHKTIITPTPQFESNIILKGSVKQKSAKFWNNSETNSIEAERKEEDL